MPGWTALGLSAAFRMFSASLSPRFTILTTELMHHLSENNFQWVDSSARSRLQVHPLRAQDTPLPVLTRAGKFPADILGAARPLKEKRDRATVPDSCNRSAKDRSELDND